MRILATRKRDSLTGDEVVRAPVVVVGTSGLYSHNSGNIYAVLEDGNFDIVKKSTNQYCKTDSPTNLSFEVGKKQGQLRLKERNRISYSLLWKTRICKGLSLCRAIINGENCGWKRNVGETENKSFNFRVHAAEQSDFERSPVEIINTQNVEKDLILNVTADFDQSHNAKEAQEKLERSESTYLLLQSVDAESVGIQQRCDHKNQSNTRESEVKSSKQLHYSSCIFAVDVDEKISSNSSKIEAGTARIKIMRGGIYHEKQVKSLCALHALNNLLQDGKAFKQEDLDKICSELDPNSWVNPHKSVFGLGNYDINVIMTALQQKQLEAIWFDKRKDPSDELNFDKIYGFILNIPSDCRLGWLALPIKRKHWVAIRNLPSIKEKDAGRSNYYNLDSKFDKPESIGTMDNLIDYLRSELKSPEKELFLVVTEDVGKLETWRKNPPSTSGTASGTNTNLLPVPNSGECGCPDASAGSGTNRRTSNDSGVVDLLPDLKDINVVDLNKEDLMRRQSSGVWSDLT